MKRASQLLTDATLSQASSLYKGDSLLPLLKQADQGDTAARFTQQVNLALQNARETLKEYRQLGDNITQNQLTRANMRADYYVVTGEAQLNTAKVLAKGSDTEVNKAVTERVIDAEIITIEPPVVTTAIARPRRYRALPGQ